MLEGVRTNRGVRTNNVVVYVFKRVRGVTQLKTHISSSLAVFRVSFSLIKRTEVQQCWRGFVLATKPKATVTNKRGSSSSILKSVHDECSLDEQQLYARLAAVQPPHDKRKKKQSLVVMHIAL